MNEYYFTACNRIACKRVDRIVEGKKKDAASLQNPRHTAVQLLTKRTLAVRLSIGEICTERQFRSAQHIWRIIIITTKM